ncbi:hypothetical protein AVEN_171521-1 [Araneus ventricosus]|uniref:Uncharacterized protein n=1 Tax=Araneus ventricosus TaxID=182803 RepID=A0A4Y2LFS7_ARAVE|nr:hypothetical protein AVEN_171521-1 [Araneus ventricosus]
MFGSRSDDEDDTWAGTPSLNCYTATAGGPLTHVVRINVYQTDIHGGSSLESDFGHGTLRRRSRALTIRPPRPVLNIIEFFLKKGEMKKCNKLLVLSKQYFITNIQRRISSLYLHTHQTVELLPDKISNSSSKSTINFLEKMKQEIGS